VIYGLAWYIQDFLWVLGTGKVIVPEFFLLILIVLSLREPSRGVEILWAGFLGGILWDLRWIGFPGLSSLFYVVTILMSRWAWFSLPISGRTMPVFGMILWAAFFPVSILRIFMGGARGLGILATYFLQQSYLLPLVLFASLLFRWRRKNSDA
jgi:rod shape-determining protein MreD